MIQAPAVSRCSTPPRSIVARLAPEAAPTRSSARSSAARPVSTVQPPARARRTASPLLSLAIEGSSDIQDARRRTARLLSRSQETVEVDKILRGGGAARTETGFYGQSADERRTNRRWGDSGSAVKPAARSKIPWRDQIEVSLLEIGAVARREAAAIDLSDCRDHPVRGCHKSPDPRCFAHDRATSDGRVLG